MVDAHFTPGGIKCASLVIPFGMGGRRVTEANYGFSTLVGKVIPEKTCDRVLFVSCETTVGMGWSNVCGQAHHFFAYRFVCLIAGTV